MNVNTLKNYLEGNPSQGFLVGDQGDSLPCPDNTTPRR